LGRCLLKLHLFALEDLSDENHEVIATFRALARDLENGGPYWGIKDNLKEAINYSMEPWARKKGLYELMKGIELAVNQIVSENYQG